MAADNNFILDLTLALGCSAVGGYIANRLKQPILLGYLATGLLIGPFGFGLLSDAEQIRALAELGVAFLLFALGVEFSLAELKRMRKIVVQGSLWQIGLTIALVSSITVAVGWAATLTQGIFLGLVLSLSSTAVVLKTLSERGETNTVHGQVMLAILIAQDLALGLMLAVLPALDPENPLGVTLGLALLKITLFLIGALALGRWVVPRLIQAVAATESNELFLLAIVGLCLSIAWITSRLGLSIEMGAFVAGLMISEIDYADHALGKVVPIRDTFASLFFASIGMLINPELVLQNLGPILGFVTLVMVGKAMIILPVVLQFKFSLKTAVLTAVGLNQIGEFSFVLSLVGYDMDLIDERRYALLLGTTAVTLVLTPFGIQQGPNLSQRLARLPWIQRYLKRTEDPALLSVPQGIKDHVIVAGYGRVGQVIVNILVSQGYPVLVIENSEAAVQRLRSHGIPFVFGDADAEQILEKTHLETAKALAIALPDPTSTRLLLQQALARAPHLDIIARSHTSQEIDLLTQMGAREVVQPEFEAALELGAHLLNTLGDPPQTIRAVIKSIRRDRYRSIRDR
ncbi:sodium:calcium exchanger [Halomicronema hongdechloris C2206]|uniref:Sodium:calcium exchanger n=1 Tax=Halomicronema hongdechloris C2206 TaxID=1641165 RepID=A0A1Z3HUF0_9CYAN|nr:cation:proton antiporter [Halomicronema hongdechloris]ASC73906.1 sodium:calcium exchanger [Halomicronema hongdechloris C2206]